MSDRYADLRTAASVVLTPEAAALRDVLAEAQRAEALHGPLPVSAHQRLSVLTEEVGEVALAMNTHTWERPCPAQVRLELVQVAATALRMIEAHDRLTITPTK